MLIITGKKSAEAENRDQESWIIVQSKLQKDNLKAFRSNYTCR